MVGQHSVCCAERSVIEKMLIAGLWVCMTEVFVLTSWVSVGDAVRQHLAGRLLGVTTPP